MKRNIRNIRKHLQNYSDEFEEQVLNRKELLQKKCQTINSLFFQDESDYLSSKQLLELLYDMVQYCGYKNPKLSTHVVHLLDVLRFLIGDVDEHPSSLEVYKSADIVARIMGMGKYPSPRYIKEANEYLLQAARKNDYQGVCEALADNANINCTDDTGKTPLMSVLYTPSQPNLEIVQELLRHGALVNVRDLEGRTALMFAASSGNLNAVKMLVEAGADISMKDNYRGAYGPNTAISLSATKEIRRYLKEHNKI